MWQPKLFFFAEIFFFVAVARPELRRVTHTTKGWRRPLAELACVDNRTTIALLPLHLLATHVSAPGASIAESSEPQIVLDVDGHSFHRYSNLDYDYTSDAECFFGGATRPILFPVSRLLLQWRVILAARKRINPHCKGWG